MQQDISRDKIKAYLSGVMKGEERAEFEREIESNEYLAAEVEWMRLEKNVVDVKREDQFREKMKEWETVYQKRKLRQNRRKKIFVKLGMTIVALTIAYFVYRQIFPTEPFQTEKEEEVQPGEGPPTTPAIADPPEQAGEMPSKQIPRRKKVVLRQVDEPIIDKSKSLRLSILENSISRQSGTLNFATIELNWRTELLQNNYEKAWELLQPVIRNGESALDPPEAFYYSALLKLYWNPDIEIDAQIILDRLTYKKLASRLRKLSEAEFVQHQMIARYTTDSPEKVDNLIKLLNETTWYEYPGQVISLP